MKHRILTTHSLPLPVCLLNILSLSFYTGSIPSEIGRLTYITILALDSNLLTGGIPTEIGRLALMQDLEVYANLLSGSIPREFGNLISLSVCLLQGNVL